MRTTQKLRDIYAGASMRQADEAARRATGVFRKDSVAIVTGASRGIGRAIALRLAKDGHQVVLSARSETLLKEVAGKIAAGGGIAAIFTADLKEADSPAALAEFAAKMFGGIDIVVNNAGATRRGDFFELTDADWADGFALKFFGAVRLVRAAWSQLKRRSGAVLNIVGVGGRTPGPEFTIGGSVNAACLAFTKAIADVGIRDGVQVNAINPGFVKTDRLRAWLEADAAQYGDTTDAAAERRVRQANVVRLGEPEDIAELASFILSDRARWLQGALIDMDGGQTKTI
jgi:NAD(P)-dependent dehydrogenase (short-subunit alcohol dehydrogenase family)